MTLLTRKLKDISVIKTGKLDSNAAVPNGLYPFFTCDPKTLSINKWAYDTEAVLLAGNNASGNFTAKYYNGKFNAYQRTYIIETADKKALNVRFLCYAINMKLSLLKNRSTGSTTKFLTIRILHDLDIPYPGISIQNKIAYYLGSIDELIENNRKQIKLLEEAAQRIYKEWFVDLHFPGYETTPIVDGIPEGWKNGVLGQLGEFKRGQTITKSQVNPGSVPVVAGGLEPAYYHNSSNTKAPVITVSASGANAGYARFYYVEVFASDCSFLDSNSTNYLEYIYCLLREKKTDLRSMQKGSAQPHVYAKDINTLHTLLPEEEVVRAFCKRTSFLFKKIGILEQQITSLIESRDRLLPKLMTGEIEV